MSLKETNLKKNKITMKRLKKQVQGITLIALVVTIIVLLILAGIALNLTIGQNGIFSRAEKAANTWRNAETNEQLAMGELANWMANYMGEGGTGSGSGDDDASREGLEVGQYVKYVPDTYVNPEDSSSNYSLPSNVSGYNTNQEIAQVKDIKWRIMSINNDGTVDLISNTTEDEEIYIYLKGATGYNNGVYILNDIAAKQYSNSSLGVTARSVNIGDIENKMNDEGKKAKNDYIASSTNGGKQTYKDSNYYPNLYAEENGSGINTTETKTNGIGVSDKYYTSPSTDSPAYRQATGGLTVTQTFYYMEYDEMADYFDDRNFYDLMFSGGISYWLASRCAGLSQDYAYFGFSMVSGFRLDFSGYLFNSDGDNGRGKVFGLRAVVSLGSNVKFVNGDGSKEHAYELEI